MFVRTAVPISPVMHLYDKINVCQELDQGFSLREQQRCFQAIRFKKFVISFSYSTTNSALFI